MLEVLKKAIYTGVGLAFLTRDKVEELARKMADETKLSRQEGEKFVQDILNKSEESRKNVEDTIKYHVESTLTKMNITTRSDLQSLESRVRRLEIQADATRTEPTTPPL